MTPDDFRAAIGDMDGGQIDDLLLAVEDGNSRLVMEMVKRALKDYRRALSTEGREDEVERARRHA